MNVEFNMLIMIYKDEGKWLIWVLCFFVVDIYFYIIVFWIIMLVYDVVKKMSVLLLLKERKGFVNV